MIVVNENILRRLMFSFKSALKGAQNKLPGSRLPSTDAERDFSRLWSWCLPLMLGLTVGWFGMTCLEVWLEGRNGRNRSFAATPSLAMLTQENRAGNMEAFLRTNPFRVTPQVIESEEPDYVPATATGALADATLVGTSPGIMAWLEDQGAMRLVMVRGNFGVYTLEEVTHFNATFARGDDRVVKWLSFNSNRPAPASPPQPMVAGIPGGGQVTPPGPGMPGVIGRDRFMRMLENPFDELRNIRLRPPEDGHGLRVEWLNNNSIFAQLGVQEGDMIQGINGIAFRNAADLSNAVHSLMGSDHFAVELVRNGESTLLHYEVR